MTVRTMLVGVLFSGLCASAFAGDDLDWLRKYVVVTTSESVDRDAGGNVVALRNTQMSQVSVTRTITQVWQPGGSNRVQQLVSRTTYITDVLGGGVTIIEGRVPGESDLVITSMTTVMKSLTGSTTTVQTRDSKGDLVVTSRTATTLKVQKVGEGQ